MLVNSFALTSVLTALIAVAPASATVIMVKVRASGTTYWTSSTVFPTSGTSTLAAGGAITVPVLSATAALASATATFGPSGASGQIVLQAAGSGPGVCPQTFSSNSTFLDSCGAQYSLMCGYDLKDQGDLFDEFSPSWSSCVNRCAQVPGCDAIVYSDYWNACYFKRLSGLGAPALRGDPDKVFGYLPAELEAPFQAPTYTAPPQPPKATPGLTTTVLSAEGLISIPSLTASASIVDATAVILEGDLLTVKVNWMIGGGRKK